jgi:hypothetical protein
MNEANLLCRRLSVESVGGDAGPLSDAGGGARLLAASDGGKVLCGGATVLSAVCGGATVLGIDAVGAAGVTTFGIVIDGFDGAAALGGAMLDMASGAVGAPRVAIGLDGNVDEVLDGAVGDGSEDG